MTDIDVKGGILSILKRIDEAYNSRPKEIQASKPKLVAVSKTKPVSMIIEAYSTGQRDFGENYVQEVIDKGCNPDILENCPEIRWHFIGHLQTNKINKIVKIPGLYMIETVDSEKLANNLNSAWEKLESKNDHPLHVLIQVNTSGEKEKNGLSPEDAPKLYQHISENLKYLKVDGVMTIGKFGHDYSTGPNPDFVMLIQCHNNICQLFNLKSDEFHISMGMSDDFEKAIEMGSTIVRVGSSIFGYRPKKNA